MNRRNILQFLAGVPVFGAAIGLFAASGGWRNGPNSERAALYREIAKNWNADKEREAVAEDDKLCEQRVRQGIALRGFREGQ